jgi:transposase
MRKPIFVLPLSDDERKTLKAGLRSPDAFVLRRCQILLASADGCTAYQIARTFGCHDQTVRNVIAKFNEKGLKEALRKGSRRPHTIHAAFDEKQAEKLKEMLHNSPRSFGRHSSLWTLQMAAEVSLERRGLPKSEFRGRPSGPPSSGWGCAGGGPSVGSPLRIRSMREKKAA